MNNGTIPLNSPVAGLRGGVPLRPETSVNYTAGVARAVQSSRADYFRIHVSDRIGITSNFTLEDAEIDALLAQGVDAARDLRRFRFFTTAFATRSQGIDPLPAPVDRGGPRAPPPNLRRGRTWLSRGRTARLPRRSSHLRTC